MGGEIYEAMKMKHTVQAALFIVLFLFLSCTNEKKNTTLIVEKSPEYLIDDVILRSNENIYHPKLMNENIVFSLSQVHSGYFNLSLGSYNTSLFLSPGDSLIISGSFLSANNKTIQGINSMLSNYLVINENLNGEWSSHINWDSVYRLNPEDFMRTIDSAYEIRVNQLEYFIDSANVQDEIFLSTERKRIQYEMHIEKNRYYRDHKFLTGKIPELTSSFDNYLQEVNFNDSKLLHLESYRDFLYSFFERVGLEQKARLKSEKGFTHFAFQEAISTISDTRVMDFVLYRIMDVHLNETPIDSLGHLIEKFNNYCKNEKYKKRINQYYMKLERLKSGNPAPEFNFPDKDGNIRSLSEFRGKLVYIDVWNSNCSPCFKEIPYLEELINRYQGKDIVFLEISFDKSKELWESTLNKHQFKGIQLFAGGWTHQFGKDYLIYSNPRFILIGKEGNFIMAKAPRPSENIDKLIDKFLN
jgi:thiol-disulfide isomerase/thioredoxin